MANPNGRKGASFERSIADWWRDVWDDRIDRRVKTGAKDKGDLANVRIGPYRIVVECKNEKGFHLAGWVKEAQAEARNDGALCGIVVAKRIGTANPGEQYVIMTQSDLIQIIRAASHLDSVELSAHFTTTSAKIPFP
jgi:hypothetical protein